MKNNKTTPEMEAKKAEQRAAIEAEQKRVMDEFEDLKRTLTDGGYTEQAYASGAKITVDAQIIVKMSHLLPHLQQRLESVQEVIETSFKIANDYLGLASLELLDLHNSMTRVHIEAVDNGETVHRDELDKQDAKKKVKEIIVPEPVQLIV